MQRPGLYFPYIQVRDDDWLKTAALFWPSIWRIVPRSHAMRDGPTARAFADAGILVDESPQHLIDYEAWDLVDAITSNAERLAAEFSMERAYRDWDGRTWGDNSGDGRDPQLGWVHVSKLGSGVPRMLAEHDLGRFGPDGPYESWIGLHPVLASAYMCALALRIGETAYMQPVTDQADLRVATLSDNVWAALSLLLGEQAHPKARAAGSPGTDIYVMLALQCARPKNPAAVDARQVIQCRENLREELDAFRAYVAAQEAELAEHVEQTIEQPLQRLEKGLRLHKLEPARSLLLAGSIAPPLAVGSALAAVGAPAVASTASGALAAIGTAWWQISNTRRAATRSSPAGYLLEVRDQLTPKTLPGRVRKILCGTYAS